MINLDTLKEALAPLAKIGKEELTFEVEGTVVHLAPLLPHQEVEVQRYSSLVLEDTQDLEGKDADDNMSRAAALDYFDKFRIEVISYAVIQVGSLNLRGVDMVETGEELDNGVKVKVKRHVAMRELVLENWSRSMITSVFSRYGDLVEKLAQEADEMTGREPADMDVEISRLQTRLDGLREERAKRVKGDPNVTNQQVEDLVALGDDRQRRLAEAAAQHREARQGSAKPVAIKTPQGTVDLEHRQAQPPPQAPPPQAPPPQAPPPQPPQAPEAGHRQTPTRASVIPEHETPTSFEEMRSSFQDGEDPDVFAAEQARILAAQRAAREAAAVRAGHVPEAEGEAQPEVAVDLVGEATHAGQVHGVDAYRLPAQEVSPRGRKSKPKAKKQGGPPPEVNPHFKPNG